MQEKNVSTPHSKYSEFLEIWTLARDVISGQRKIHAKGETYLPKLSGQTNEQYSAYKKRANFYNASWRTISILQGLVFRKDPVVSLPTVVEQHAKDISMSGVSLLNFAKEYVLEKLSIEFVGILVDYPVVAIDPSKPFTKAVADKKGLRPTLQLYKAESIINWKFSNIDNKHVLSMVILKEHVAVADGEFGVKDKIQYRVIDLDETGICRVRIYEVESGSKNVLISTSYPIVNNSVLTEIPFFADFNFSEPALVDLYDANVKHYQIAADYYHGMHFQALPTLVISGYVPPVAEQGKPAQTFNVGSETALVFPNPDAKAEFVEFQGSGLSTHKDEMNALENRMANLGIKTLANEKAGVEAYKTTAARNAGEFSVLSNVSITSSDALTEALKLFSKWSGFENDEIEYKLNREFLPLGLDATTLTAYLNAFKQGGLDLEDLLDLLKRADLVRADKTLEEHKANTEKMAIEANKTTEKTETDKEKE